MTFLGSFFDTPINFTPNADRYPVFADVILVNQHDGIARKNEGKRKSHRT